MAFKEKSEKALLAMSKEEQISYWQEFQDYYKEQKKKIQKKQNERAAAERQKNRRSSVISIMSGFIGKELLIGTAAGYYPFFQIKNLVAFFKRTKPVSNENDSLFS